MKKIIFSPLLLLFLFVIGQAQPIKGVWCEPDTIISYDWDYNAGYPYENIIPAQKRIYTYNDDFLKTTGLTLQWDDSTSVFSTKYGYIEHYRYDEQKRLIQTTLASWDVNLNNWISSYQYDYQYVNDNLAVEIWSDWVDSIGTFVNSTKIEYDYDQHRNLTLTQYYTWNNSDQDWQVWHGYSKIYTYDENYNIIRALQITLNSSDTSLYEYTYDNDGYVLCEIFSSVYGGGEWEPFDSTVYTYADNHIIQRITRYEWNRDSLAFIHASWNGRLTYTYDENNNRIRHLRETYNYDIGGWQYDGWNTRIDWTYENDNAVKIEAYAWNENEFEWEKSTSGHVDIYYNNMRSEFETMLGGCEFRASYICYDEPVTVKEMAKSQISCYPNPAQEQIFIGGLTERSQFTMYDISGKLILKQDVFPEESGINIANLKSGLYIIEIRNGHNSSTHKLIKQ